MSCCPHGETTLCQHGFCGECAHVEQHDADEHAERQRRQAEWEMLHDPTSDLYYSDAAVGLRGDAS